MNSGATYSQTDLKYRSVNKDENTMRNSTHSNIAVRYKAAGATKVALGGEMPEVARLICSVRRASA
jgi:hypothetical protein